MATDETPNLKSTGMIAAGISVTLILLVILQHNLAFQKKGTIVLPAGGTYLGPTSVTTRTPAPTLPTTPAETAKIDPSWVTVKGKKYPYSFKAPKTLKLVTFPNDQFDIYAISIEGRPADQNVLIGVDDLKRSDDLKKYITVSKRSYVENWWKQFGGLKGVGSIIEFTNSAGLKGYRAKFLNSANQSPNEDVFFEVPDPNFVIHLASGVMEPKEFNALVDSVAWNK